MSPPWVFHISLCPFQIPPNFFYVCQMLKGYHKKDFRLDSRLPISLQILHRLTSVASQLQGFAYQISQFQGMCSLAF